MKYYSEITNKIYETREELEAAEQNHKQKLVAKAKEEELRKAELEKAVVARDNAKAEYEDALRVCREALSRWNAAERELVTIENRNRSASDYAQPYDDFKKLAERWGLGDWFFI